jgi:hypothetical protein
MIPCRYDLQEIEKVGLKIQRLMDTQILGYIYMRHTSVPSCSTDNVLFVP